jgi:hypothetical protein
VSGAVRCGFCPGATVTITRISRTLCAGCARRLAGVRCPECDSTLTIDMDARDGDGAPCTVAFCNGCEFAVVLTAPETRDYTESHDGR